MSMMDYIIVIGAMVVVSAACSLTRKGFSLGIFLAAMSIGISILVWADMLPFYALVFAIILIVLQLFKEEKTADLSEG